MAGSSIPWMGQFIAEVKEGLATVKVPAPYRGILTRLIIRQIGGSPVNFKATGYTSEQPSGMSDTQSEVIDDSAYDSAVFQFTPELSGTSGKYSGFDLNYGYVCNELASEFRRDSAFYLKIDAESSSDLTYHIAVTVLNPLNP